MSANLGSGTPDGRRPEQPGLVDGGCISGAVRAAAATEEEMLNRIAAIQAAAEILEDNHALSHGDRCAFLGVIQSEAMRLQAHVRQLTSSLPDDARLAGGHAPTRV